MERTISFWLIVVLLAAWPLVLVALFALSRRFPSGVPDRARWMLWAALASIHLAGSAHSFLSGAHGRGFLLGAAAIAVAAGALAQRRRATVSKRVEAQEG